MAQALKFSKDKKVERKTEVLFYVDETPYSMYTDIPSADMLEYMDRVADGSVEAAQTVLLKAVLGAESWAALKTLELTTEEFEQLFAVVQQVMLGATEKSRGN